MSPDRTDPVEVLIGQGKTRIPELLLIPGESYSSPGVKFVDSLLEGAGFEPSVPRKPRPAIGYSLLIMKVGP